MILIQKQFYVDMINFSSFILFNFSSSPLFFLSLYITKYNPIQIPIAPKSERAGPYKHALSESLGKLLQSGTTFNNNNISDAMVAVNGCNTVYAKLTEGSAY